MGLIMSEKFNEHPKSLTGDTNRAGADEIESTGGFSADLMVSIYNHLEEAIIVLNAASRIQSFNSAAKNMVRKLTGGDIAQGNAITVLIDTPLGGDITAGIKQALTGSSTRSEIRYHASDNVPFWISLSYVPIIGEADSTTGVTILIRDMTKTRRTEHLLQESRERFRSVLEAASNAIALVNLNGRLILANQQYATMFGYENVEQMLSEIQNSYELVTPEHRKRAADTIARATALGYLKNVRYTVIRKDGTTFPVQRSYSVVRDMSDSPTALMEITEDLSEQIHAREALDRSEATAHALLKASPVASLLINTTGMIIGLNDRMAQYFGKPAADLKGTNIFDVMPSEEIGRRRRKLRKIQETRKPIEDTEVVGGRTYQDSTHPIFDNFGNVDQVAIYTYDITELKRTEEALRDSEQKFRTLTALSPTGIFLSDANGNLQYVNKSWCTITGVSAQAAIEDGWQKILHPDDREPVTALWEKTVKNGRATEVQHRLVTKDGKTIWASTMATPLFDVNGELTGFVGTLTDIDSSKSSEEEARRRETRFRAIANYAYDLESWHSPDCKLLWVNPVVETLTGYSVAECMKMHDFPFPIVFESDLPLFANRFQESLAKRSSCNDYTIRLQHKDGSQRYASISWKPIYGDNQEYLGIRSSIHDITQRRTAEEKLLLSQKKLTRAQEIARLGSWELDLTTNHVVWSDQLYRICGVTPNEFDPNLESFGSLVHPDDWQENMKIVYHTAKTGDAGEYFQRVIRPDGETRFLQCKCEAVFDGRKITRVIGTAHDITEFKRTEDALRQSQESLKAAQHLARLASWVIHLDTKTVDWSEQLNDILNRPQDRFQGSLNDFLALFHPEDKNRFKDDISNLLHSGKGFRSEYRFPQPDGSFGIVDTSCNLIKDKTDRPLRIVGSAQDITDRKKHENEILKTQKLESLGVLAGGIAHDFNNLLTGMLGNITLAKLESNPTAAIARLNQVEQAIERANDLTKELLTYSKGSEPIIKAVEIDRLIQESISFGLRGSNVKPLFTSEEDVYPVVVDASQINQVIYNIVLNSTQAMPDGGTIRISYQNIEVGADDDLPLKAGQYVKISIADKGIGIKPEHLPKVFDPYFSTWKNKSGLGMAASYSIIKRHNGHIDVESKVGVGTTFHVYLPADKNARLDIPSGTVPISESKGRVLIMDDEEMVRDITKNILRKFGYTVSCTTNGHDAIDLYRQAFEEGMAYDVVILDLTVPGGLGGKEAVQELLKINSNVRTIVCSGYSNDPIMTEYAKYGFSGVVTKPYKPRDLLETIKKLLSTGAVS